MQTLPMRFLLVAVVLVASCQGRCRSKDAVYDAVPNGSLCAVDRIEDRAICIDGDKLITCRLYGVVDHTTRCTLRGRIIQEAEASK